MIARFRDYIQQQHLFSPEQEVLLAVSGGIDSVVLCHLMHQIQQPFAIVHCNFHLRPDDCDRDQEFVHQLALRYGVPFHTTEFDTSACASMHHQSIEEAARQLRYDYFGQLIQQHHYACLATGHHRDDSAETFFINLLRGTGIAGLHGILPSTTYRPTTGAPIYQVVRPLLPFGRNEIEQYAQAEKLQHVEDATNASLDYQRNRIRHQLMPLLRQLQPYIDITLSNTIHHLQDTEQLYQQAVETYRQALVANPTPDTISIHLETLRHVHPLGTVLFELLRPYGFNTAQVDQIADRINDTPGACYYSSTHRLTRGHDSLVITPLQRDDTPPTLIFTTQEKGTDTPWLQLHSSNEAWFDADSFTPPLSLRHWRHGDRFQPLGMNGSRLLSDFFSDQHLSLPEKEQQWLLVDANDHILWIVGRRTDHCFRITDTTQRIIHVESNTL